MTLGQSANPSLCGRWCCWSRDIMCSCAQMFVVVFHAHVQLRILTHMTILLEVTCVMNVEEIKRANRRSHALCPFCDGSSKFAYCP